MDGLGIYLGDKIGRAHQCIRCKWGGGMRGPVHSMKSFTMEVPFCEMNGMGREALCAGTRQSVFVLDLLRSMPCKAFPQRCEVVDLEDWNSEQRFGPVIGI